MFLRLARILGFAHAGIGSLISSALYTWETMRNPPTARRLTEGLSLFAKAQNKNNFSPPSPMDLVPILAQYFMVLICGMRPMYINEADESPEAQ